MIQQYGPESTVRTHGGLHFLRGDKSYGKLECVSDNCMAFSLHKDVLQAALKNSEVAESVVYSLQREIRGSTKIQQRTPLTRQKQSTAQAPLVATSVAATCESFYRSALNAYINAALTGKPVAKLFPDMHVQAPMRVLYINGTKGTRTLLDKYVNPQDYASPGLVSLAVLLTPGLSMTPISSVLEAANAGHANPEPLARRWMRGIAARAVREIIFAIGLNQASDFMEERVPQQIENGLLRNAVGSLSAGIMAGYFSHVPHNLSALKLMNPDKDYWTLFKEYAEPNKARMPAGWSESNKELGARAIGVVMPKAVGVRTVQIVGTFILLNGIIFCLRDVSPF